MSCCCEVVMSCPTLIAVGDGQGSLQSMGLQRVGHDWATELNWGFPVLHCLPELAQTHVHWVSDAIQPFYPLSSRPSPAFKLSQHQSFPKCCRFASGSQIVGASTSAPVFPMNVQDWFPLGWTGRISLQVKGLSRVFSNTTVQKHQFFGT